MVKRNYFAHVSKSGTDFVTRLTRTGYLRGARAWTVGENLAWGSGKRSTPREIVAAWMNSPGHRANILQRRFREIGIGVVFGAPRRASSTAATYTTDVRRPQLRSRSGGLSAPGPRGREAGFTAYPRAVPVDGPLPLTHLGGPLLVLGGAGTGKTHAAAAALRVAGGAGRARAFGARPRVLAQCRRRPCARRSRSWSSRPTRSCTCTRSARSARGCCATRRPRPGWTPASPPSAAPTGWRCCSTASDELSLRQHEIRGNPAPLLAGFVARIDRLKEEMVAPEQLTPGRAARGERRDGDDAERSRARASWSSRGSTPTTTRLLAERGALDTGDLVLRAFRLLHEQPARARARRAARFGHVLVDDYQDANFAQATLLGLLCEEHGAGHGGRRRDQALTASAARVPRT